MPPERPPRTREAAFTSCGIVLVGVGFVISNGWPLVVGGLILLFCAVAMRA